MLRHTLITGDDQQQQQQQQRKKRREVETYLIVVGLQEGI
jgi:hypothetical protein